MIKKQFTFLLIIVIIILSFCSCNSNEQESSISTKDEVEPTIIKLTKNNYSSYLDIFINQTTQTQSLVSNTYYVEYRYGYNGSTFKTYTGLTPPTTQDVLQCIYLYSTYSVSTTFVINCQSTNNNYVFSNCNFSIVYTSSSRLYSVTIYVSQNGTGNRVFMMSEVLSTPNKTYSFQLDKMISDFNGEVSFFDSN